MEYTVHRLKWILGTGVCTAVLFSKLVSLVSAATVEMEYTDPEHIHAPKIVDGVGYQYDANGNLVNDGERVISWNQDNLPTRIEKDGKVVEFFYDANGQRIVKSSKLKVQSGDEREERTIYPSPYLTIQQFNNLTISERYYFAGGKRIAFRSEQTPTTFLHSDHLGSTVLATNSNSQTLSDPLSYFPYGSSVSNLTMEQFSNYLFTGQELDDELNLYNYNARLYNPETGVFISADPVQGLNRYAYAKSNPIRFTDPTGLWVPEEEARDWRSIIESHSITDSITGDLPVESALQFALFMEEKFSNKSVTSALWKPVIPEATELFGAEVVGAITGSLNQFDFLQCVGFARACARALGGDIPPLGWEGLTEVGKELSGLSWHGSEDIMESNFWVAPGDFLSYSRQKTSHLAVITEVVGLTATFVEAVGTEFNRGGIYAPAGGIMVNERTIDLSTGEVTGMYPGEIIGWGVYRVNQ